jgi:uncharacterized membrane protein
MKQVINLVKSKVLQVIEVVLRILIVINAIAYCKPRRQNWRGFCLCINML